MLKQVIAEYPGFVIPDNTPTFSMQQLIDLLAEQLAAEKEEPSRFVASLGTTK